jgi:hypothetical protein
VTHTSKGTFSADIDAVVGPGGDPSDLATGDAKVPICGPALVHYAAVNSDPDDTSDPGTQANLAHR